MVELLAEDNSRFLTTLIMGVEGAYSLVFNFVCRKISKQPLQVGKEGDYQPFILEASCYFSLVTIFT